MRATFNGIVAILGLLAMGPASAVSVGVDLLKMPLRFEVSPGQPGAPDEFVARGPGYAVVLTPTGVRLQVRPKPAPTQTGVPSDRPCGLYPGVPASHVRVSLVGANPSARLVGAEELTGKVNYFRGSDPTKWRRNMTTFAKVRCE
jgi:hypothetical protein